MESLNRSTFGICSCVCRGRVSTMQPPYTYKLSGNVNKLNTNTPQPQTITEPNPSNPPQQNHTTIPPILPPNTDKHHSAHRSSTKSRLIPTHIISPRIPSSLLNHQNLLTPLVNFAFSEVTHTFPCLHERGPLNWNTQLSLRQTLRRAWS